MKTPDNAYLDNLIRQSLKDFVRDIFQKQWYGKEREAISFYAFGYLVNRCQPETILYDPAQIGIEVLYD